MRKEAGLEEGRNHLGGAGCRRRCCCCSWSRIVDILGVGLREGGHRLHFDDLNGERDYEI